MLIRVPAKDNACTFMLLLSHGRGPRIDWHFSCCSLTFCTHPQGILLLLIKYKISKQTISCVLILNHEAKTGQYFYMPVLVPICWRLFALHCNSMHINLINFKVHLSLSALSKLVKIDQMRSLGNAWNSCVQMCVIISFVALTKHY